MIGFLHLEKTSASMASTLDKLQKLLEDDYYTHFSLLLTDRGSEFEKFDLFENNYETNEARGHIFYCDPQRPDQKTPYEVFKYFYGDDVLKKLNIQKIEKDTVTLQPYLLKIK